MTRIKTVFLFFTVGCASALAYQQTAIGIKATVNDVDIDICFMSDRTVRVLKAPANSNREINSLSVIADPAQVEFTVKDKGNNTTLTSPFFSVTLNNADGTVSFARKGSVMLREDGPGQFTPINDA